MKLTIDNILLIGSILLFVSLIASRTTRYGIPTLLLFLLVGMLAGCIIIALVERNNKYFISEGSTSLHPGDRLYVMADDHKSMGKLYICLGKPSMAKINKSLTKV